MAKPMTVSLGPEADVRPLYLEEERWTTVLGAARSRVRVSSGPQRTVQIHLNTAEGRTDATLALERDLR